MEIAYIRKGEIGKNRKESWKPGDVRRHSPLRIRDKERYLLHNTKLLVTSGTACLPFITRYSVAHPPLGLYLSLLPVSLPSSLFQLEPELFESFVTISWIDTNPLLHSGCPPFFCQPKSGPLGQLAGPATYWNAFSYQDECAQASEVSLTLPCLRRSTQCSGPGIYADDVVCACYRRFPQLDQGDIFSLQDAFNRLDVDDRGYLDESTAIKAAQQSERQPYDVVRQALKGVELDSSRRVELEDYVDVRAPDSMVYSQ